MLFLCTTAKQELNGVEDETKRGSENMKKL